MFYRIHFVDVKRIEDEVLPITEGMVRKIKLSLQHAFIFDLERISFIEYLKSKAHGEKVAFRPFIEADLTYDQKKELGLVPKG